tara:strand:+ start:1395 stop:2078 length:684 start_codon:yes stop_codon:yes gene_type:complete
MKIVITGCSQGIGKKISNYLSKDFDVVGISRRPLNSKKFKSLKCDILMNDEIYKTFKKIKKFDVLINCAGISHYSENVLENFDKILKTNLYGSFFCSYNALKYLRKSANPSIINISSINAYQAFPNNPGYVASKGGLNSLTRSLALDYAKYKIRVNSISPGYIREGMAEKSFKNKKLNRDRKLKTMLNRWGKAEDLFGIIDYLINKKSKYVTAQDFVIDGGWINKGL